MGWLSIFSVWAVLGEDLTFDGIVFVRIPAGNFVMGTTDEGRADLEARHAWNQFNDCERPAHRVTVSKPFLLGKFEVTQKLWRAIMTNNPSAFKGDDLPVDSVSWNDAQQFLKRLNARGDGKYRLPTEAEWEYGCRAGGTNLYGLGADATPITRDDLGEYAWIHANADHRSHPVGARRPNAWGLFDMLGNVWEWCQDWYPAGPYPAMPAQDPVNTTPTAERVMRGGSWFLEAPIVRASFRSGNPPASKSPYIGFRLARDL